MLGRHDAIGCLPGLRPRLIAGGAGREDLAAYRRAGGYGDGLTGEELIAAVQAAGLRGRGGAAFPAGIKWRSVRERPAPRFVLANGGEREPMSFKDRYLLGVRPHLVIDGLLRAATAIDAEAAYLYVADATVVASVEAALDELGPTPLPLTLVAADGGYVGGEETAAIRAIAGEPALPAAKPPRPFEEGIGRRPTLVHNVETLAHVPAISRLGPDEFRRCGSPGAPGTFLLSASGACGSPGVYEVPLGIELKTAFAGVAGGFTGAPSGFLVGGFFGGLLPPRAAEVALDYDVLRAAGSGLGCGAIRVLGPEECPVAVAAAVMDYFAQESSGQCGPCVRGTGAMSETIAGLCDGTAGANAVDQLTRWSQTLRGRGACGLLDGAAVLAASLVREFADEVERHLNGGCAVGCAAGRPTLAEV